MQASCPMKDNDDVVEDLTRKDFRVAKTALLQRSTTIPTALQTWFTQRLPFSLCRRSFMQNKIFSKTMLSIRIRTTASTPLLSRLYVFLN